MLSTFDLDLQLFYVTEVLALGTFYSVIVRPYIATIDNVLNISQEIFLLVIFGTITVYQDPSKAMTMKAQKAIVALIFTNVVVVSSILGTLAVVDMYQSYFSNKKLNNQRMNRAARHSKFAEKEAYTKQEVDKVDRSELTQFNRNR